MKRYLSFFLALEFLWPSPIQHSSQYQVRMRQEATNKPAENAFSIQMQKKDFLVHDPESLACRIPPRASLSTLLSTPEGYMVKNRKFTGYPTPSLYPDITTLMWNPLQPSYNRARSSVYQEGYDYHTSFFPREMNCLDTTITNRFPDSLLPIPPVLEWIQNEPVVILVTHYGKIIAWQPDLAYIKWEKSLPLNENLVSTMATYQNHSKFYLLFTTDRNILYQIDMETGREEKRILLDESVQSPIQVLESDQEILVVLKTNRHIVCWDAIRWQVLCKKQETAFTDLSPLIVQVGHEKRIIQPFPSGRILSLEIHGETRWDLDTQGEISQDIAVLIRDGSPWLSLAISSGHLLLVEAIHGVVHRKKALPGTPVSSVVFESAPLSVSLLVETQQGATHFFSTDLEDTSRRDTEIPVPVKKCLSFFGIQTEQEPFFCFINEKLEWIVVEKGLRKVLYPYPSPLSESIPDTSFLPRNPSIFVRGALLINLGISGFVMIGTPIGRDDFTRNESKHSGSTHENSVAQPPYTNQSSRTGIDIMPNYSLRKNRRLAIPYHPFAQSLLNPVIWVDKPTGAQFGLIPVYPDTLLILDDHLQTKLSLTLSHGTIYTEPIVENDAEGELTIWVLTEEALLKVGVSSDYQKRTIQVLAEDVGSLGGSFLKCSRADGYDLIWVDDLRQLTVFSMPQQQIRFKEPVNARNIALHSWDGEKYLFCGSQVIRYADGEVIFQHGTNGSTSTVVAFQGRLFWIQSTEDDLICRNGMKDEVIWEVRRLWCKSHCFFQSNAAVWFGMEGGRAVVADYQRVISIDLARGFIQWRYASQEDIFISQPVIIKGTGINHVLAGSIRGKLYLFNGSSGELARGFPLALPGEEEKSEKMKGASTPVFVNGLLWIQRLEYGLIQFGQPSPSSIHLSPTQFQLRKKNSSEKNGYWIRSILYWKNAFSFSNRLKIESR